MILWSLIMVPALIAAGATLAGGLMSAFSQKNANDSNIAAQERANQQNIAFQKEENEIARQREDTAVQRRLADVKAAGFSPLAAIGNGAGSAAMTAPVVSSAERTPTDFSFVGSAADSALNAYNSSQARKMQQQIYDDNADARAAELRQKVAAADSAESEAIMKQMDALGYGKKLGLESSTVETNLESLKQDIRLKEQDAKDRHEISELQKVGLSRDNALKSQEIRLGNETLASRIENIKNETDSNKARLEAIKLSNELNVYARDEAKRSSDNKKALDSMAKEKGYLSYDDMLQKMQQASDDRNFKKDVVFGIINSVLDVIKLF